MDLKTWLDVVGYRITEGGDFYSRCLGPHAYSLTYWNGEHDDGHSASIVFDRETQTVYIVEVCDYAAGRAYRLIDGRYRERYVNESEYNRDAWDGVRWIDLDVEADWVRKASAIINGTPYDTRVEVPLELDDSEMFRLMVQAHERDITLNALISEILERYIGEQSGRKDS